MNRIVYSILIMLVLSTLTGSSPILATDSTPPQLHDITVNTTNVTVGDTIVVTINATDPEGISYVELSLHYGDGSSGDNRFLTWLTASLNSTTGLYHGSYQIQLYDTNNSIFVSSVYLTDINGNYVDYYNSLYYSYTPSFTLPDINVYGTDPDLTPPTLVSASFSSNVATGNQIVGITIEAEDNQSGLGDYAYTSIYRNNSVTGNYWDGDYITDIYLTRDGTKYSGEWTVNQYLANGTYIMARIELNDNKNNYIYYENATSSAHPFNAPYLNISNTYSDVEPPAIYDLYFEYASLSDPYEQVLNTRIVEDLSGLDYGYFDLYYYNTTSTSSVFYGSFYVSHSYLNSTTGLYELPIDYVDSSVSLPEDAEVYIGQYYLTDKVGNDIRVDNYDGSMGLPSFQISKNNPTVRGPRMEIDITPQSPTVPVDVSVNFDIKITNLMGTDISGNISLDVSGGETGMSTELLSFFEGESVTMPTSVIFPTTGEYRFFVTFITDSGQIFSAVTMITVVVPLPDGKISISVDARDSVIEVDKPATFDIFIENRLGYDVFGYFELNVIDNSSWNVAYDNFTILTDDTHVFTQEIVFPNEGGVLLEVQYMLDNGTLFSETFGFNVLTEYIPEQEIIVDVIPDTGYSEINTSQTFTVSIQSTFLHDMFNVTLRVSATGPSSSVEERYYIDLLANSSWDDTVSIEFTEVGTYNITMTLIDDIGTEWNYSFNWEVRSPSTSTESTSSGTATNSSSNTIPSLPIPGFEINVVLLGIGMILAISTYQRRRKY